MPGNGLKSNKISARRVDPDIPLISIQIYPAVNATGSPPAIAAGRVMMAIRYEFRMNGNFIGH